METVWSEYDFKAIQIVKWSSGKKANQLGISNFTTTHSQAVQGDDIWFQNQCAHNAKFQVSVKKKNANSEQGSV